MRRRLGVGLVAAAVLGGLVVLPGSPAAAEEYDGTCDDVIVTSGVFEITSDDGQAQPGGTFTFGSNASNLRVQKDSGHGSTADVHLVVAVGDLDDQIIPLGDSFTIDSGPDFGHRVWDQVPDIELDAPEGLGEHPITAVLVHYDFPSLDRDCVLEGGPFAQVVVSDDPPPTTTTTTTTTTVPDANGDNGNGNGNGENGNGNGNGENGNGTPGVPPGEEEAVEDAVDEVVEDIAEEVGAAERALTVGAAPRFAG